MFDLSIILNVHDETKYLARTLRACEEAVRFAQAGGASSEIIVVLDRPAAGSAEFIAGYDFSAFDGHQIIISDNGSLGPSRNDGIRHASGTYITTCDADDMISFNAFDEMLAVAREAGPDVILVPQYLVIFGSEYYVVEYFDSSLTTPMMFTACHPYHSRLFAHRRVFENVPYTVAHPGSGYVYEDWHFNCEATAHGYQFKAVPETVLFCRRRQRSLLTLSNQTAGPQIPPSTLFSPRIYLDRCRSAMDAYVREGHLPPGLVAPHARRPGGIAALFADPVIRELTSAANAIDPAIDIGLLDTSPFWTNLLNPISPGAAYYRLCEHASPTPFTDVVLLPPASPPSTLSYIYAVIEAIQEREPEGRALILSWDTAGTRRPGEAITETTTPNMVHADLQGLEPDLREQDIETVIIKALQSLAPGARVHVIPSAATMAFVTKFLGLLAHWRLIGYRLPDPVRIVGSRRMNAGPVFEFISSCFEGFAAILVPDAATLQAGQTRLGIAPGRWHDLPPPGTGMLADTDHRSHCILCLPQHEETEVQALMASLPAQPACGGAEPAITIAPAQHWPDLEALDLTAYDAVLCLDWDGLTPSWALRALGRGIPVIAPRNELTEALFPHHLHELLFDAVIGGAPAGAANPGRACDGILRALYAQPGRLRAIRAATIGFGRDRYSVQAFRQRVHTIMDSLSWTP